MKMQSPFVCKAFGAFQDTGNLYIVMEFIPGGDLATLIEINKVRPPPHLTSISTTNQTPAFLRNNSPLLRNRNHPRPILHPLRRDNPPRHQTLQHPNRKRRAHQAIRLWPRPKKRHILPRRRNTRIPSPRAIQPHPRLHPLSRLVLLRYIDVRSPHRLPPIPPRCRGAQTGSTEGPECDSVAAKCYGRDRDGFDMELVVDGPDV